MHVTVSVHPYTNDSQVALLPPHSTSRIPEVPMGIRLSGDSNEIDIFISSITDDPAEIVTTIDKIVEQLHLIRVAAMKAAVSRP